MPSCYQWRHALCTDAAGAVALLSPAMSHGQSHRVDVGDKIRLRTIEVHAHFYGERLQESAWVTGTFVHRDGEYVRLKLAEDSDTISVRRDSIASMEKSLGLRTRESSGKFIGMLTGAIVGAGIGVAIAYLPKDCRERHGSIADAIGCGGLAFMLGTTGFVVGGWGGRKLGGRIGEGIHYEKWERLRGWGFVEVSLHRAPPSGGSSFRVGAALRF